MSTLTDTPHAPAASAPDAVAADLKPNASDAHDRPAVSQRSVVRSEWIKFRSVRSNFVAVASGAAALILLGMLFSSLGDADRGPRGTATDSLSIILGGLTLSQVILGVTAAVFVTSEYASGLMRTMFGAVGRRSRVLWAKAGVAGAVTWVMMTAAAFVTFFAGNAVFGGDMPTYGLGAPGVLRAILGAGFYAACVTLIGIALGFVMRSTAAAIGVLVTLFMVAPILLRLVPGAAGDWLAKIVPSGAGDALMSVTSPDTLLTPLQGLLTLSVWVVGLLATAWVLVRRRDA